MKVDSDLIDGTWTQVPKDGLRVKSREKRNSVGL